MKRKAAGCKRLSHLNDCNAISVCKEMENIHSLLMFDVVQADASISDELKKEIEKDGVVLYEKA